MWERPTTASLPVGAGDAVAGGAPPLSTSSAIEPPPAATTPSTTPARPLTSAVENSSNNFLPGKNSTRNLTLNLKKIKMAGRCAWRQMVDRSSLITTITRPHGMIHGVEESSLPDRTIKMLTSWDHCQRAGNRFEIYLYC